MLIKHKADLQGTSRAMATDLWSTTRFLLREDGAGLTLTDVTIAQDDGHIYGYQHHQEVGYCLEGRATLEDLATGEIHDIIPGSLWLAQKGERFRFIALSWAKRHPVGLCWRIQHPDFQATFE